MFSRYAQNQLILWIFNRFHRIGINACVCFSENLWFFDTRPKSPFNDCFIAICTVDTFQTKSITRFLVTCFVQKINKLTP